MSTKHTRRAPNDGNTHGPSWRAGYDAGHARHEALLAALREIAALAANEGTEVDSLLADIRAIATAAATSEVYSPGAGKFDNLGRVRS